MNCYYHFSNNLLAMENNENNMVYVSVVWIMIKILQKWIGLWLPKLTICMRRILLDGIKIVHCSLCFHTRARLHLHTKLYYLWTWTLYGCIIRIPFSVNLSKFFASTFLELTYFGRMVYCSLHSISVISCMIIPLY